MCTFVKLVYSENISESLTGIDYKNTRMEYKKYKDYNTDYDTIGTTIQ